MKPSDCSKASSRTDRHDRSMPPPDTQGLHPMATDIRTWLLDGDVAIVYHVARDLTGASRTILSDLQHKIERQGWGRRLLACRRPDGNWGKSPYQPKWTSTHYTLLELREMGICPENALCQESASLLLNSRIGKDGGINYFISVEYSDVCVNGMLLNFASYFTPKHPRLPIVVDYLLDSRMRDGGWNCESRTGATHSSFHTTISVLEGLGSYLKSGNNFRISESKVAIEAGIEFLLRHRLFRSHRTGEIVDRRMLRLSFPSRWRYDILRALDCLRSLDRNYDQRLQDAIDVLISKRAQDGRWRLESPHKGNVHFQMEKVDEPSRWNTLRALRVLTHFQFIRHAFEHIASDTSRTKRPPSAES